jgi:hypothetical protein
MRKKLCKKWLDIEKLGGGQLMERYNKQIALNQWMAQRDPLYEEYSFSRIRNGVRITSNFVRMRWTSRWSRGWAERLDANGNDKR